MQDLPRPSTRRPTVSVFMPSLRGGGAERAMIVFAGAVCDLGLPVDLVVASSEGPLGEVVDPRVRVIDLGRSRVSSSVPRLVSYLRRERPSALFATIPHANLAAVAAVAVSRVPVRLVLRESNSPVSEAKRSPARRLVHALTPRLYGRADAVIAVSEGVAAELREMNPRLAPKIAVLPTPVIDRRVSDAAGLEPDHPWFRDGGPPVVTAVGRLAPQKDYPTLFSALASVPEARLLVLGEGRERGALESLVTRLGLSGRVSMPGFVVNPFACLARSRLFVLSSVFEGMPNVLIQALALGVPVVSTDCPSGPREVLAGGTFGTLVPPGDVPALAAAIRAALAGPRPDGSATAARFRGLYGAEDAARAYLSLAGVRVPADGRPHSSKDVL